HADLPLSSSTSPPPPPLHSPSLHDPLPIFLRLSLAPPPSLDPPMQHAAEDIARRVIESLEYVGVLAIEFYENQGNVFGGTLHRRDRKSTRLNSSHVASSYAVFCLKKKNNP